MTEFYVLRDRKPVPVASFDDWAREFARTDRDVDQTMVGAVRVSTVFLGVNHRHFGGGPPLVFETMIFGGQHDQWQDRCSTWDEAVEMHERACKLVRGELN